MTDQTAGDGAAPAAPPAPNGAAASVLTSPPPPPFWDGFADANLKLEAEKSGWKSNEEVFTAAHKLAAFKDADPASLALKPKADDPNAFVAFAREHLGAPTEAAAYGLDAIEGVDKELAGVASGWFTEAGLTKFQAQHVAAKQMEYMKAQGEAQITEEKVAAERELTQLKTEWGSDYTPKLELARRSAKALGVDAETMNYLETGMGAGKVIQLFERASKFFKEGDFVDGDRGNQPKSLLERLYPGDVAKDRGRG
jgi:hypothetical protein